MPNQRCRKCKKRRYPRQLNKQTLCSDCASAVNREIETRTSALTKAIDKAIKAKSVNAQLRCYARIDKESEALIEIEKIGIRVMDPPPSYIRRFYNRQKKNVLVNSIENDIRSILKQISLYKQDHSKLNAISKLRLKLIKHRDASRYYEINLPKRIDRVIDQVEVQEFLYQGKKAGNTGDVNGAVKLYKAALNKLMTDDIDDSKQAKKIKAIKMKIANS